MDQPGVFPDHPWRKYLQRSALALKSLTYAPTGALLAASTTSLPETPHGERNWDYRYAWIRDSTFALWGLYTLGLDWRPMTSSTSSLMSRETALSKSCTASAESTSFEEHELKHDGIRRRRPVRIGNGAYNQKQHDVWGAVLDSVYLHVKSREQLSEGLWPILVRQVEEAVQHWKEPDRGIWEVRGEPQHFVSSKLFCWVALDRGTRLADMHDAPEYATRWRSIADEIKADICENGVDKRGVFVQRYGSDALDAFAPAAAAVAVPAVGRRAGPGDRTRDRGRADRGRPGAALPRRGDRRRPARRGGHVHDLLVLAGICAGRDRRDRKGAPLRAAVYVPSPLELFAEEIDASSGRHLGNFPQAFTHLALINAVMHLIRAEDASGRGFAPAHRL